MTQTEQFLEVDVSTVVVATGFDVVDPHLKPEFGYGVYPEVITTLEFERLASASGPPAGKISINGHAPRKVVFIQCVGSRDEERPYCSRVCCSESVKNALNLKKLNPQTDVYILYRDMRTYGFKEDYYRQASEQDVKFIRYEPQDKPVVASGESDEGKPVLKVTVTDFVLGKKIQLDADIIALAAAVVTGSARAARPSDAEALRLSQSAIGRTVEGVTLTTPDGERLTFEALRGRPIVLSLVPAAREAVMGTWVLILFLMTADGGTYSTTMQNIQSRGQCVSAGEDYSSRGYNGDTVTSYMCVEGR